MKPFFALSLCLLCVITSGAQNVSAALQKAVQKLESDPQMQQAMLSVYVADAATGKAVFTHNSSVGMAPASTQKLITGATAYALLGRDFRYRTQFALIKNGAANTLAIQPSGDPTLGSWRWKSTSEAAVVQRIATAVRNSGAGQLANIMVYHKGWNEEAIPGGWTWEDMGNYYGAGAYGLNWRENQYDVLLRSGNAVGDAVQLAGTVPKLYDFSLQSQVRSAAKGTGDRTLIYLPVMSREGVIRGTIPVGERQFKVSGAMPNPMHQFTETLSDALRNTAQLPAEPALVLEEGLPEGTVVHEEVSPSLDSIIYWFNQKSINLYGEALLKTMALQKGKRASTEDAVTVVKDFWKAQGIPQTELNIADGSGLSPANRVTTRAQVAVLLYAKKQAWYPGLFASLPVYNGMKMKSGTIGGVKGFAGYHTAKSGTTYAFSILINNYNGAASGIVQKMYAVLNELK
ncbi:D-alanyl-D-alanine carboxypeptidase/D-alanyl-D-alanine endopeptidase [Pseudocnuella soli]|uniref:D-alanyl-D-alanine carboxypeptidase/D-alanyl-D-alanine endopeptidase n=1 Tax=Pseudocnuella soli TaxID=2502779 RepID=UPI00104E9DEA|nr:D-alanyl-D-alanine carboxypeptidase/D-alanyl-D-alanine-endopeptidase [Pseudocnuella soli]